MVYCSFGNIVESQYMSVEHEGGLPKYRALGLDILAADEDHRK